MAFTFSKDDVERIAGVLGVPAKYEGSLARMELFDEESGRQIALETQFNLEAPPALQGHLTNLVSVYGPSSFQQLQGCTGFLASQELGEVIFFARCGGVTNGLVVERQAGSSLYANVDDRLLSTDFTQLAPELIMSSVALSMTESIFNDLG